MLRRFAILVIAAAILVAAPSAAAQTGSPPGQEAGTVIVTATRLSDSAAALRACIARNCPPDQDIEASIAHAENLFVAGDYKGARTVLLKSRARNLRHADAYPQQFAGLLRANARIGAHLGDADTDRFDTIVAIDVLKRAYSAGDFNLLRARFDLGDFWLRKGEADNAMAIYRRIERDAVQQPLARGMALLRQLIVLDVVEQQQLGGARRSRIEPLLLNDPDPALAPFQVAARVLELQRATKAGDPARLAAATAAFRRHPVATTTPILLSAPPIDLPAIAAIQGFVPNALFEGQWIDVSFWIDPDGTVHDVDVVRSGPKTVTAWQPPVLASIAGRRYAPFDAAQPPFAQRRFARVTYTSDWIDGSTQSRLRTRSGTPNIEILDMTAERPTGPASETPPRQD